MTKNIIITGGAGFIGTNLALRLADNPNNNIYIIDNCITSNEERITQIANGHSNITFIKSDICNKQFQDLFQDIDKIHEIYHLASLASPVFYDKYPIETLDVGYIGTKNILDLAVKHTSRILYTSTSEVYGDALESPQKESYYGNVNCFGNRSCYDEAKRISETLCFNYKKIYNLEIRIARIFNTYGPFMNIDDGRIIPNLLKSILTNSTLDVFGTGNQTRCFCYVDDTVDGLIKLMQSKHDIPVNIGNNSEITINDLIHIAETLFKKKINIQYTTIDPDDPKVRQPDLTLANTILNWRPIINLNVGLVKTLRYFLTLY